MPRILAILAFLAVVEPTVVGFVQTCVETCPDDGPDGTCPPACTDCACCVQPVRLSATRGDAGADTPPPRRHATIGYLDRTPATPDPQGILHVPRRAHG